MFFRLHFVRRNEIYCIASLVEFTPFDVALPGRFLPRLGPWFARALFFWALLFRLRGACFLEATGVIPIIFGKFGDKARHIALQASKAFAAFKPGFIHV